MFYKEDWNKVISAYLFAIVDSATDFTNEDFDILYKLLRERSLTTSKPATKTENGTV